MSEATLQGTVYKSTGSWYAVRTPDGGTLQARIKGRLRIDGEISSTNPIAVGDEVVLAREGEADEKGNAIISEALLRRNYMVRVSPHNKHHKHIVAANLDLALVMATITMPRTSQGFIDRFLITAEAYHIPPLIIINKTDLLKEKHLPQLEEWTEMYRAAGYDVITMNALSEEDLAGLQARLRGKTTLFSGHSGVGKSTLINRLMPGADLRTGVVSDWSGKGQHTTTFAEMFDLPDSGGGRIIDTPGVKEFGLIDFAPEEVGQYFPEIRALMPGCRFNNCLHTDEPECAVKDAVASGEFPIARYESYLSILGTIEQVR